MWNNPAVTSRAPKKVMKDPASPVCGKKASTVTLGVGAGVDSPGPSTFTLGVDEGLGLLPPAPGAAVAVTGLLGVAVGVVPPFPGVAVAVAVAVAVGVGEGEAGKATTVGRGVAEATGVGVADVVHTRVPPVVAHSKFVVEE